MSLPLALAVGVVVIAALYLVAFGAICLAKPPWAGRFLLEFAGTPIRHDAELAARVSLVAGGLVLRAALRVGLP